jgi:hypothetical protein
VKSLSGLVATGRDMSSVIKKMIARLVPPLAGYPRYGRDAEGGLMLRRTCS